MSAESKTPDPAQRGPEPRGTGAALPLAELLKPREPVPEIGGRSDGSDPTRYGDWEKNGRCIDF